MSQHNFYFIDIFAGGGGLSEGFERMGFTPIAFVEKDYNACMTLRTRQAYHYLKQINQLHYYNDYLLQKISREQLYNIIPQNVLQRVINETISHTTIQKIFNCIDTLKQNKKVDVIIGGPPCQTYSIKARNIFKEKIKNDERNFLFLFYIEFLKKYKPKLFIFENVMGFLSANNSKYFNYIIDNCQKLHYNIQYTTLDASHFGVLQNKKRVFIVGHRQDISFTFPSPYPELIQNFTLHALFEDLPLLKAGERIHVVNYTKPTNAYLEKNKIRTNDMQFTTQHFARNLDNKNKQIYTLVAQTYLETGKHMHFNDLPARLRNNKIKTVFTQPYRVLPLNDISYTLIINLKKYGHEFIYPNTNNPRSISTREAARIQSFPDDYYFEGSMSDIFMQIGNAVPVLLSEYIAQEIKNALIK